MMMQTTASKRARRHASPRLLKKVKLTELSVGWRGQRCSERPVPDGACRRFVLSKEWGVAAGHCRNQTPRAPAVGPEEMSADVVEGKKVFVVATAVEQARRGLAVTQCVEEIKAKAHATGACILTTCEACTRSRGRRGPGEGGLAVGGTLGRKTVPGARAGGARRGSEVVKQDQLLPDHGFPFRLGRA